MQDRVERLSALRDLLTASLAEAGAKEQAGLARELRAVLAELAALAPPEKVDDPVTKFRKQGAPRGSGAKAVKPPVRSGRKPRTSGR